MRTIGMVEEKVVETIEVEAAETKAEMIANAEAEGIELSAAEKRLSKEKLAQAIKGKRHGKI